MQKFKPFHLDPRLSGTDSRDSLSIIMYNATWEYHLPQQNSVNAGEFDFE